MPHTDLKPTPQPEARMLLIDATMTAIATLGFSNLTLTKISALAGLTAGTVNFHFSTKEALLLATLKHLVEEFETSIEQVKERAFDSSAERLAALLIASLDDEITEFKKIAVWYAFFSEASSRNDYHQICGDRERNYAQFVGALCEDIIASAGKENELNAAAVSKAICGLVDEIWQEILFEGEGYDLNEARRHCSAFLASVFPWCFEMPIKNTETLHSTEPGDNLTHTLPGWIYGSAEFFELEKDKVFMGSWQLVCHTSDLLTAGQYVTFSFFNERAFVIRTAGGEIKAFRNVCRHRAHILLGGEQGECPGKVVCPYHGWTYNLDGERTAMGFPDSFREHDAADFSLHPVDCEIYGGFVFI